MKASLKSAVVNLGVFGITAAIPGGAANSEVAFGGSAARGISSQIIRATGNEIKELPKEIPMDPMTMLDTREVRHKLPVCGPLLPISASV
jgi:hypothetical protein